MRRGDHAERLAVTPIEFCEACSRSLGAGTEQVRAWRQLTGVCVHRGTELASQSIAGNCRTAPPADRVRDTGHGGAIGHTGDGHRADTHAASISTQSNERGAISNAPDQAASRERPLRRRALTIAWPHRVDIRRRKPCVLALRRLFG